MWKNPPESCLKASFSGGFLKIFNNDFVDNLDNY